MKFTLTSSFFAGLFSPATLFAQQHADHAMPATATRPTTALALTDVAAQPLLAQAIRLQEALAFLGSSLSEGDAKRLKALQQNVPNQETVGQIQALLDPYCLAMVTINPEAWVTVQRGPAPARLIQGG